MGTTAILCWLDLPMQCSSFIWYSTQMTLGTRVRYKGDSKLHPCLSSKLVVASSITLPSSVVYYSCSPVWIKSTRPEKKTHKLFLSVAFPGFLKSLLKVKVRNEISETIGICVQVSKPSLTEIEWYAISQSNIGRTETEESTHWRDFTNYILLPPTKQLSGMRSSGRQGKASVRFNGITEASSALCQKKVIFLGSLKIDCAVVPGFTKKYVSR